MTFFIGFCMLVSSVILTRGAEIAPEIIEYQSVNVEYQTVDCKCKGVEIGSSGKGPRTLKVNCTKTKNKTKYPITCEYKGNPHGCAAYNNHGQQKFYRQALNDRGSKICSLVPENLKCPRGAITTKLCGDMGNKNLQYLSGP